MKVLRSEMEAYAPFFKKDYERTVQPWQGAKPSFTPVLRSKPGEIAIQIRIGGSKEAKNKWLYLDKGTRPHKIRVRRARFLAFASGKYRAGSSPNSTFTSRSTKASGPTVYKKEVHHPGFPARNFTQIIVNNHQRPFAQWMEAAMRKAAAASGHGGK